MIWVPLLLFFGTSHVWATDICKKVQKCTCYPGVDEDELQCPPLSYETKGVIIHIRNDDMELDCYNLDKINSTILPDLDLESLNSLELKSCPLSGNFHEILEKFHVRSIELLKIVLPSSGGFTLDKNHFQGFESLKNLSLGLNESIQVAENLLENTPNLIMFEIEDCNLNIEHKPNLLQPALNLQQVFMLKCNLEELPDGLFNNLSKLKVLQLWSNKFRIIKNNSFEDLEALTVLELSNNLIETIEEGAFSSLKNLKKISLAGNNLSGISSDLFQNNNKLELIRLWNNPDLDLPDYVFSNLLSLTAVELNNCNLKQLHENVFKNSPKLEKLQLNKNRLKRLSFLKGLLNLRELYLSNNQLEIFEPFEWKFLKKLELEGNLIEQIHESSFKRMPNLEDLSLKNNKIAVIDSFAFASNFALRKIDLSHNLYSTNSSDYFSYATLFANAVQLRVVSLSHNKITDPGVIMEFPTYVHLKEVDLSFNYISEIEMIAFQTVANKRVSINLANNRISTVSFHGAELLARENFRDARSNSNNGNNGISIINLANNPINCDCHNYDLYRYFSPEIMETKGMFELEPDSLSCSRPQDLNGTLLRDMRDTSMVCDFQCLENCSCSWRPSDKAVIVYCSDKNLTEFPELSFETGFEFTQIHLHLENNDLVKLPDIRNGSYNMMTELYLSHNRIKEVSWLPPSLKVLHLDHNEIKNFNVHVLDTLKDPKIVNLTLEGNPWTCDCSSQNFTDFLRQQSRKVDTGNIRCEASGALLRNLNKNSLCKNYVTIIAIIFPLCFLLMVATSFALYYRYKEEIKVWLFAKGLFLWWVTEEELDKDKEFDAFISYSHKDEDFFIENLLPVLESGPTPYKLLLHYRNWIPGLFITEQIIASVEASRRTVVILSQNFLKSVWGREEFRTAHSRAISERRARIIVILLGEIDMDDLDPELQAYLKTNTYVKWGDAHFWNKLRYALPHKNQNFRASNQRHANMMQVIDDKFDLVASQPPNSGSTPPVLTADSELAKNHLNFKPAEDKMNFKPAEDRTLITSGV